MQKNTILIGAVVIVILAGIVLFVRAPQTQAPTSENPILPTQPLAINEPPAPPAPSLSKTSSGSLGGQAPSPSSVSGNATITITDVGFSPTTITVKKGTAVVFKNESSGKVWPAADPHPTHAEYPAQGGCIASVFDACEGILSGESWSFTFDILGTWDYHDHRNPLHEGTVVVQ